MLGFEDCSAKTEAVSGSQLSLTQPWMKQHEQLAPKAWSFYSFDVTPEDYQVVVNVAAELDTSCEHPLLTILPSHCRLCNSADCPTPAGLTRDIAHVLCLLLSARQRDCSSNAGVICASIMMNKEFHSTKTSEPAQVWRLAILGFLQSTGSHPAGDMGSGTSGRSGTTLVREMRISRLSSMPPNRPGS